MSDHATHAEPRDAAGTADAPTPAGMTLERLERIATHLGVDSYCRHWPHWNAPTRTPWLMAVACVDYAGKPVPQPGLEGLGFERSNAHTAIYTVERVDGAGQPWAATLPKGEGE